MPPDLGAKTPCNAILISSQSRKEKTPDADAMCLSQTLSSLHLSHPYFKLHPFLASCFLQNFRHRGQAPPVLSSYRYCLDHHPFRLCHDRLVHPSYLYHHPCYHEVFSALHSSSGQAWEAWLLGLAVPCSPIVTVCHGVWAGAAARHVHHVAMAATGVEAAVLHCGVHHPLRALSGVEAPLHLSGLLCL
jgi:hypothetical protein